jgi:hypothetical protein
VATRRRTGQSSSAADFLPKIGDGVANARRGVGVDLPGFYAGQRSEPFQLEDEKVKSLTEAVRELYWLTYEVHNCAETARSLAVGNSEHAPADLEAAMAVETRRMLLAWFGLREEIGAPYRDARMLLTTSILGQAGIVRLQRAASVRASTDITANAALDASASLVCRIVGALYPTVASAMQDPARHARVRAAIESAASSDKRTPWPVIAAVWNGIEKGDPDPERWRKDWHEHQQSLRP